MEGLTYMRNAQATGNYQRFSSTALTNQSCVTGLLSDNSLNQKETTVKDANLEVIKMLQERGLIS